MMKLSWTGSLSSARRRTFARLAVALSLVIAPRATQAGLGPEGVIVVVNARSWASQTVANYFIRLRQIPASNVVYLDWSESVEGTNSDAFRASILEPVVAAIRSRGLAPQVDAIVYSADLPTAIDISRDLTGKSAPQQITPVGSLNGLTYLWEYVLAGDINFVGLEANNYLRRGEAGKPPVSHGFRNWYGWDERGSLIEGGGRHYVLSTVLAVTAGRGNSVAEAVRALTTSASADGTLPTGTIYFARNDDVRSQVRHDLFETAAEAIRKFGVKAEVVEAEFPRGKSDIRGVVAGAALIDWKRAGSIIEPGAIGEHFTSFGGELTEGASQTPLTDFLRYGAAGASGTVTEPYAIAQKFPTAFVQLHYVRGCTLAEAFYQSVAGPYQLLIVGDPLCRPWARIPTVTVAGVTAEATVKGTLALTATAQSTGPAVDRFELFVDGQRQTSCAAGEPLTLDTTRLIDGYHELRIVGLEASDIETQGRAVIPVWVDNNGRRAAIRAQADRVSWGQKLVVTADAPESLGVAVYHNSKLLGTIRGDQGTLELDPQRFGVGPVVLRAIALGNGGPRHHVAAKPLELTIDPGPPLEGQTLPGHVEGLLFEAPGGIKSVVTDMRPKDWFIQAGGALDKPFTLSGYFDVTAAEIYQFHIRHDGRLKFMVDDQVLYEGRSSHYGHVQIVPVNLGKGSHRLRAEAQPDPEVRLELKFGGQGVRALRGRQFWHQVSR